MPTKTKAPAAPRVVAAVATAASATTSGNYPLAEAVQNAMQQAVVQAISDGVDLHDQEEMHRRMAAARNSVPGYHEEL